MSHLVVSQLQDAFKHRHVTFVGGPCLGGKSTRLKIASLALRGVGVIGLDTSTVIGSEIKNGTELGMVFARTREECGPAALQPDAESMLAIARAVREQCEDDPKQEKRIIIVGTPRTPTQARWIIQADLRFSCVHFTASERQTRENLDRRLAENRPDDNPKDFEERLRIYWQETVPALTMLRRHRSNRFREFETGHHNVRKAVIVLIEAVIGRNHPQWNRVTNALHCNTTPAGELIARLAPSQEVRLRQAFA